jgi:amino acid adenylation domain-containing protein
MTSARPSLEVRSTRAGDNGFEPRDGFEPFRLADAEQSLSQWFSRVALKRGDAVAIVDEETVVTYGTLLARASAIATALRERLGDRPGPVVLQLAAGASAIEALLGVLFAGRAYLFLDPAATEGETSGTVAAAIPAAIVVDSEIGVADAPTPSSAAAASLRIRLRELAGARTTGPAAERHAEPQDLACLFSTSGTTGTPKLVGLSHRAVLFDIGRQINDLCLGPDDRFDLLFSPSFSASLSPIFTALLTGGELHVLDVRDHLAAPRRWLERAGITVSRMNVSTFRALSTTVAPGDARACPRLLSVGGEPLLARDVARFKAIFPASCVLQNAMASTETRTYAQYFVPRGITDEGPVPIGWAVYGKEVVLLDEDGQPVAGGQPGEIAVRSRFLARGYTNDPDLTARRFLPQQDGTVLFRTGDRGRFREDGCLLFLGRADSLVKIRGYRVEPEAVEAALATHERISQSAVIVHEPAPGELALAAYVVPCSGATVSTDELRAHLIRTLPAYSVPSSITLVDSLPVTRHGKVDRRALSVPNGGGRARGLSRPNAGTTRSALLDIWKEVLPRPGIGPGDNFFECGGDSLNALRLQLHVHERFGVDLPLDVLVRRPTIEGLAEWLDRIGDSEERSRTLTRLQLGGSGVPLFCVPGIGGEPSEFEALTRRLGSDQPVYGFRARHGGTEPVAPTSIEGIAANCLTEIDAVVPPEWPVQLCGHSFGGLVAFEIAQRLRAAGRRVGLVAIIDTPLARGDRRRLPRRVLDVLANLPAWIAYDALESSWRSLAVRSLGRAELLYRRVRASVGRPTAGGDLNLRSYFGVPETPARFREEVSARFDAARNYNPVPYAGTVTLFRARARWLTARRDRHLGWGGLALGGLEVFDVPGNHDSCLSERHVRHLADPLKARLAVDLRVKASPTPRP